LLFLVNEQRGRSTGAPDLKEGWAGAEKTSPYRTGRLGVSTQGAGGSSFQTGADKTAKGDRGIAYLLRMRGGGPGTADSGGKKE